MRHGRGGSDGFDRQRTFRDVVRAEDNALHPGLTIDARQALAEGAALKLRLCGCRIRLTNGGDDFAIAGAAAQCAAQGLFDLRLALMGIAGQQFS